MKNFIVYDSQTGAIKRIGICQDMDFKLQAHAGEKMMEGQANDDTQKIDLKTGTIVPRTDIVEREEQEESRREAARAKRDIKKQKLEAILRNPVSIPDVKTLASILLERGV